MVRRIGIGIVAILAFAGCTRDDICSEDTPTTPLLQIAFKDISNRTETKTVSNFRWILDEMDTIATGNTTDTLVGIPLNTEANTTILQFLVTTDDGDNADTLTFSYATEEVYVNRACAFKITYNQFNATLAPEIGTQNWIRDLTVEKTTIEDETEAHLTIFH